MGLWGSAPKRKKSKAQLAAKIERKIAAIKKRNADKARLAAARKKLAELRVKGA